MFEDVGMLSSPVFVSLVMGVASGMPADPAWLPLLVKLLKPTTNFQVIAIGRETVWPLLRYAPFQVLELHIRLRENIRF